ncbi:hypothetical protein A9Q84_16150 [Halobacteriovorax marinus]|uniref:GNAT family N-acetyltransferase n=1 Tax=Halobacteriovorax marinus TaxID=97084 RepID=A0A1Y5F485_9BACT|nr:hypothetical protein A9Q84_16150 [Halobacteriovorax marinus]
MSIKVINQIEDTGWEKLDNTDSPFLSYDFFQSLEESHSIGASSGWKPVYITDPGKSLLYSFIKDHSYGEYIFDWDWARAYDHHGIPYYPKLTSMIPFTSATTPHFLGEAKDKVMDHYEEYYQSHAFSSSHFLFLPKNELSFFESYDYTMRESFQYHFINDSYGSFSDFLAKLKNRKAKQIKKERLFSADIQFKQFTGVDLTLAHAKEMYQFYLTTIDNKQAIPYLNESFFDKIFVKLRDQICYVQATRDEIPIAGALYFYSSDRLYGRYWGATETVPNLHFELCYYQGIDFCIKKGLEVFEAGAQGEHKISRGFRPVKTYSAHKLKHESFHEAVKKYVLDEKLNIDRILPQLNDRLPFK